MDGGYRAEAPGWRKVRRPLVRPCPVGLASILLGFGCKLPAWLTRSKLTLNLVSLWQVEHEDILQFPLPSFRRSPGRSMQSHRDWLLVQHGPVCAYCGTETTTKRSPWTMFGPAEVRRLTTVRTTSSWPAGTATRPRPTRRWWRSSCSAARGGSSSCTTESISPSRSGNWRGRPPNGLSARRNEDKKGGPRAALLILACRLPCPFPAVATVSSGASRCPTPAPPG